MIVTSILKNVRHLVLMGIFLISHVSSAITTNWIATIPGNWNDPANWSAGVPGSGDFARFDGAAGANGNCILDVSPTVGAILISGYTGTIDMNGNALTIGGLATNNAFTTGFIDGSGTVTINATVSSVFDGTTFGADVIVNGTITTSTGTFTASGSTFNGLVAISAYRILLNGSTFNNITQLIKTGNILDAGTGGNTFNEATAITNASTNILRSATTNPDEFNGGLLLSLQSTSSSCKIQMAYSASGNELNSQLNIKSLSTGVADSEISFGAGGGTTTLMDGATISEDPAEFLKGDFWLNNVSQETGSTTALSLELRLVSASGTNMRFKISNCTFYGNVDFSGSNIYVSNSNFYGSNNVITKTLGGCSDGTCAAPHFRNTWAGGNTFNTLGIAGVTQINNMHNSTLVLAGTSGDIFNGDAYFYSDQASSAFRIAETGTTIFRGDVTLRVDAGTPSIVRFGVLGGITVFNGTTTQSIASSNSTSPTNYSIPEFFNMVVNSSGNIQLNRKIRIATSLDLVVGNIISTNANFVEFEDGSTVTSASNDSFIEGPVHKIGDAPFTFPLGAGGLYHPLSISAPGAATSEFVAEYFGAGSALGTTADVGINKVSTHEYWTLAQSVGADNVSVVLGWVSPFANTTDYITEPNDLRVLRWDGTDTWNDMGVGTVVDNTGSGTVSTAATIGTFGTFTLGSVTALNKLPVELTSFKASLLDKMVVLAWETASELNNDHFEIERSNDARFFITMASIMGNGTTNLPHTYSWTDTNPLPGWNYYRLRQVDFDGTESKSKIVHAFTEKQSVLYPNPAYESLYLDQLGLDETSRLTITNASGVVFYNGFVQNPLPVDQLPSGLYSLSTTIEGKPRIFRFFKK